MMRRKEKRNMRRQKTNRVPPKPASSPTNSQPTTGTTTRRKDLERKRLNAPRNHYLDGFSTQHPNVRRIEPLSTGAVRQNRMGMGTGLSQCRSSRPSRYSKLNALRPRA